MECRRSVSSTTHDLAKRSGRPIRWYWADFQSRSSRNCSASRTANSEVTSPASRPSFRSLYRVVLTNFGERSRSSSRKAG